jgi:hypothetical protein
MFFALWKNPKQNNHFVSEAETRPHRHAGSGGAIFGTKTASFTPGTSLGRCSRRIIGRISPL